MNIHGISTALNAHKKILQCTYTSCRLVGCLVSTFVVLNSVQQQTTVVGCFTSFVALQAVPQFSIVLFNSVLLHFFGAGVLTVHVKFHYSIKS